MHADVFMRGCVRACVVSPHVPGCMRVCACALECVMCMFMHILARMRARACVMCACTDKCMYNMHEHITAARVVSKKQHRRQEGANPVDFLYIYIPFFSLPPLSPLLSHGIIISLYNMNTHI